MPFVFDRRRHRVFAFAASTALTLGLLFLLAQQGSLRVLHVVKAKPDTEASRAIAYLDLTKIPPPTTPPLPSMQAPKSAATFAAPPPSSKPRNQLDKKKPGADVQPLREAMAITLPVEPAASQPEIPRVAPAASLRLDADTLRKANAHSKSSVQSMADAAGEALQHGSPRSEAARREESIAQSGKPDCIGPNAGGDILITPILIAIQAARGKCK